MSSSPTTAGQRFIALSCVGFIASLGANAPAAAQTAGQEEQGTQLQGVTITDTVVDDAIKVDRAESPKTVRPLLDTPQTITVIGNTTIRAQNLLTLRDALATLPGITFGAGEGGGGFGDSINLRGQSANNDLQIDGVRDTAQYSRSDTFNIEQIEVVNGPNSVNAGSGSIGGTINLVTKRPKAQDLTVLQAGVGTDNYYRATSDTNIVKGDVAFRLNAMFHRNDVPARDVEYLHRWGIAPSVTFGIGKPTSLTLLYSHQEDNNIPSYGVPYYTNGVTDGPVPGVDYGSYYGYRNVDRQKQKVDVATMIFSHEFSDKVSVRNLTRYLRVKQDLVVDPPQGTYCLAATNRTPAGTACTVSVAATTTVPVIPAFTYTVPQGYYSPSGPRGNYRDSLNNTYYDQLDLTMNFAGGHTLVIGASALAEDYVLDSGNVLRNPDGSATSPLTNANNHLPFINIANPNDVVVGPLGAPGALTAAAYGNNVYSGAYNPIRTSHQVGELFNVAAYAFGAVKIVDKLEINAGARYEHNRVNFRSDTIAIPSAGGTYTTGADQASTDNLFSYRVGLVYKPIETASLYIAYGNSKTPASTNSRSACGTLSTQTLGANPCGVAPQTAVNYEAGAKADLFNRGLQLTASVFRNERTNYPVASNDPFIGTVQVNDGRSRVDGIALGASGKITPAWSIFANYTYLKTKVLQSISDYCIANPGKTFTPPNSTTAIACAASDVQKGNPLTNVPKSSGSLFTTYLLPFGLQLGYGLTFQGAFYLTNSAPIYASKRYITHRAFLSYPITGGLTAQLNIQNFTDKKYYTGIRNNGWAVPGEGRQGVLSVFYSF
jgi:catecholate siderophore receptor